MDIMHNLRVTGHKLHDNIILYSWISKISIRDEKKRVFLQKNPNNTQKKHFNLKIF